MAETFEIEVVTPERRLVRDRAQSAQIPGKDGYLGILPGHAALLSELGVGCLTYATEGHRYSLAVHGGYVEVLEGHVRVLADRAEPASEIDKARAERALQRAQERLQAAAAGMDLTRALHAALRAEARLQALQQEGAREE